MPFVQTFAVWCALALVQGVSNPLVVTPTRTMILAIAGRSSGTTFSITSAFFGLGSVVAPVVFVWCEHVWGEERGFDVCFVGLALLTLLVAGLVPLFVAPPELKHIKLPKTDHGNDVLEEETPAEIARGQRVMVLICVYLGFGVGIEAAIGYPNHNPTVMHCKPQPQHHCNAL